MEYFEQNEKSTNGTISWFSVKEQIITLIRLASVERIREKSKRGGKCVEEGQKEREEEESERDEAEGGKGTEKEKNERENPEWLVFTRSNRIETSRLAFDNFP